MAPISGLELDDIDEDAYIPKGRSLRLRAAYRLLRPLQLAEFGRELGNKLTTFKPNVLLVYKGSSVTADDVRNAKAAGILTVNVFPDYSPHAYGERLKEAMGEYDLVVSTKPFHPGGWRSVYGYKNPCVCVPHGYDPRVHYWPNAPSAQDYDVVLAASWRPQYGVLMQKLAAALGGERIRVGVMGGGWREHAHELPSHWEVKSAASGRGYGEWVRRGKIVIAPVHREVVIGKVRQPGDEDTTRTYELASMGSFFLHHRTTFAQTVYDEATEVPMWTDADELARLVRHYLPREAERQAMALRAHHRAVPAYSIPSRAVQILDHIKEALQKRGVVQ
jgi:hypothetical protein